MPRDGASDIAALRQELERVLGSAQPSRDKLLALIQALDLAGGEGASESVHKFVKVAIARATYATSTELGPHFSEETRNRLERTAETALAYACDPHDAQEQALFEAATQTYPFGPGDGCLAVEELGGHGTPGSGCVTGAGFLNEVAAVIGHDAVLAVLRREGLW